MSEAPRRGGEPRPAPLALRAVAIALVFAAARAAAAAVSGTDGRDVAALSLELAAGVPLGLWLAYLAPRLYGGSAFRVTAVGALVFVSLLAVMIEGAAFAPRTQPPSRLPADAMPQLVVAALVGLAALPWPAARRRGHHAAPSERSVLAWLGRYAACVLVYVVLYFAVGALAFTLVTGPYYDVAAAGLVVPPPQIVLLVATVEGALLPLAVLPLLHALPVGSRRRRALIGGAGLVLLGGVVPLIVAPSLPLVVRVASAVEILLQKLPAGVAAALWLGPDDRVRLAAPPRPAHS